jgi:altronate dehydratase small subunit
MNDGKNKDTIAICINPNDNVATLMSKAFVGTQIVIKHKDGNSFKKLMAEEIIQTGHKIAIHRIPKGEVVIKYGEIIGRATQLITKGGYVHVHNLESLRGRGDLND